MTEASTKEIDLTKPRDIYNRPRKLQAALEKVQDLDNSDREDVLKFVKHMNDNRTCRPDSSRKGMKISHHATEIEKYIQKCDRR